MAPPEPTNPDQLIHATIPQVSPVSLSQAPMLPVSPTGTPVMPQWLVIAGGLGAGVAGLILGLPTFGVSLPPAIMGICSAFVALGAAFGIASPGVRKKP